MIIFRVRSEGDLVKALKKAVEVLESGGLVVIPTETVYGLAAKMDYAEKVYEVKKRPKTKPLPVQSTLSEVEELGEFSDLAKELARVYWPGPLTMVVKAKTKIPETVTAGTEKVGIRVPKHEFAYKLLEEVGPLVVTSANLSGYKAPKAPEEVNVQADLLIDMGPVGGIPSTVIEVSGNKVKLIREGAIPFKKIVLDIIEL